MAHLISNHKKFISALLLIFLISFLGIFCFKINYAKAGAIDFFTDPLGWLLTALIGLMSSLIVWFGKALELAVTLLKSLLIWPEFTKASIVQIGWRIIRDIANMFFVFILLVIAFATILRRETYGMKALLPKLVIAALLINFSLVIAGVIIDSSQVLTDFFISQSGGSELMGDNMMNATQAVKAIVSENENIEELVRTEKAAATGNIAIGAILTVIFLVLIFLVMGAYAFFLIVRMVFLWFLLIFAPIVWILWIMPQTKHLWNEWWKNFLKWCFFAPIAAFFIYLSIFSYKMLLVTNVQSFLESKDTRAFLPLLTKPANLLQFLLTMSILFGGLVIAPKFGVYGADGAIGLAKGMRGRVVKLGKRVGKGAAVTPIKAAGLAGQGFKFAASKMPYIKKTGWAQKQARQREEQKRKIDAEKIKTAGEKYEKWTSKNLKGQFKSADPRAKAAIAKILASRGEFAKDPTLGFDDKQISDALQIAKQYGQHKDILKTRPDLATNVGENILDIVSKLKPADIEKLQPAAIDHPYVQLAIKRQLSDPTGQWRASHLAKIADINPSLLVSIKDKIIDPNRGRFRNDINNYLSASPGSVFWS